jgi:beta-galactosidase GanA
MAVVGRVPLLAAADPDLWRDQLEKLKAAGFNTVSLYVSWAYHSPAPGVFDFSGVRDIDRLLDIAEELGLYVLARPGPYINAELDSGGYPAWLTAQAGRARTNADDYQAAWEEWFSAVNRIIARRQFTNGRGPVILFQIENEYDGNDAVYMEELKAAARRDGITVPIFHNDKGRNVLWSAGPGAPELYATDTYPAGFDCNRTSFPGLTDYRFLRDGSSFDPPRPGVGDRPFFWGDSRAARSTRGAGTDTTAAERSPARRSSGCSTPTTSRTSSPPRTST